MTARFLQTDDSATFFIIKKAKRKFPTPHGFHFKDLSLPLTDFENDLTGFSTSVGSLKKLFLTRNWLHLGTFKHSDIFLPKRPLTDFENESTV